VSLSRVRGDAVLLTFLDAGCSGICPVESAELRAAERDLGAKSASVDVLVVNLDGSHRTVAAMGHLAQLTGLDPLGTFHTLTGTMTTLRTIWKAYGVQVQVDEVTGTVLYEPLILFIDPSGHERYRAVPTGFELPSGRYVAPAAQITEFAQGIAHFAAALLPGSS